MTRPNRVISPPFLVAAGVLLIAGAAIHGTLWANGMRLIKQEAELRQPLMLLEQELGPYVRTDDERLSKEQLEEVGTDRYILWTYEDESAGRRAAEVQVFLAYYSGMPEAKPRVGRHVQLVPGLADGPPDCRPLQLPGSPPAGEAATLLRGEPMLCVRSFAPPGRRSGVPVAYAYIANGQFVGSPEAVHRVLTDPHHERAWWAKLEIRVEGVDDADEVRAEAQRFLAHALPAIAEVLPTPGSDDE